MSRTSTIERLLEREHGDLHKVIPKLASQLGQQGAADRLKVNQRWISRWLDRNGYVLVTRYEKESA